MAWRSRDEGLKDANLGIANPTDAPIPTSLLQQRSRGQVTRVESNGSDDPDRGDGGARIGGHNGKDGRDDEFILDTFVFSGRTSGSSSSRNSHPNGTRTRRTDARADNGTGTGAGAGARPKSKISAAEEWWNQKTKIQNGSDETDAAWWAADRKRDQEMEGYDAPNLAASVTNGARSGGEGDILSRKDRRIEELEQELGRSELERQAAVLSLNLIQDVVREHDVGTGRANEVEVRLLIRCS